MVCPQSQKRLAIEYALSRGVSFIFTPLYSGILNKDRYISFHTPGHKFGNVPNFSPAQNYFMLDTTETYGMDNLHDPNGIIKDAQSITAKVFGAKQSYFLVNGTTCGIQALIYATCREGDTIIVDRHCHSSVIGAISLCGAAPIYLHRPVSKGFGICGGVDTVNLQALLSKHPSTKAVFITNPTYYGVCSNLSEISRIASEHNVALIVDEAHGAHFPFHKSLPQSALSAGCDGCVQSWHKTLPALTQSSVLHTGSNLIDRDRLAYALSLFQTSSPSYILMSHLDRCRDYMVQNGSTLLAPLIKCATQVAAEINSSGRFSVLDSSFIGKHFVHNIDPMRLVLSTKSAKVSATQLCDHLFRNNHIACEMHNGDTATFIITVGNSESDIFSLWEALETLDLSKFSRCVDNQTLDIYDVNLPARMTPREVDMSTWRKVSILDAENLVSAQNITTYPPGIPLVCKGEVFSSKVCSALWRLKHDMVVSVVC